VFHGSDLEPVALGHRLRDRALRHGDAEAVFEAPADIVVEGLLEMRERLILGGAVAADGRDLCDAIQEVPA
jgi:hypothetical protein